MTAPAVRLPHQSPEEHDLLSDYQRSGSGAGGETGSDFLSDYDPSAAPRDPVPEYRMAPTVVTPPVMGRTPFAPPPPRPTLTMPPAVVTPPVFGRPPAPPAPALAPPPRPPIALEAAPAGAGPPSPDVPQIGPGPIAPPARPDVARVGLGELAPPDQSFSSRVAVGAAGLATHPWELATALPEAAAKLRDYFTQRALASMMAREGVDPNVLPNPTGQEAAAAGAQIGASALAGPVARVFGRTLAPAIGSRAAAIAAGTATGAGVGATFAPNDPAVGAALGAVGGAGHAVVSGARAPVQRPVFEGPPAPARSRIGPEPEQPPARSKATARVEEPTPKPPAAPPEPDFTVEDSDLLTQYEASRRPQEQPAPAAPAAAAPAEAAGTTKFDTPKVVAARARGEEIGNTAAIATPEREQLRQSIADQLYGQGAPKKNREATMLLGPPAAGKTTFAKKAEGALVTDADEAKKLLPEYEEGAGTTAVHIESSGIRDRVVKRAVENGDNLVIQTLGRSPALVEPMLQQLEAAGYTVHLKLIDVPKEVAAERAVKRYEGGEHFVDPAFILEHGELPRATYAALKHHPGVTTYAHYNTDVARGEEPRLIEQGTNARAAAASAAAALPEAPAHPERLGPRGRQGTAGGHPAGRRAAPPPRAEPEPGAVAPPAPPSDHLDEYQQPSTGADEAPVVQRTIEEEGTGASETEVRDMMLRAEHRPQDIPSGPAELRKWVEQVLGRPYESRTWKMDDVYDAIEGGVNARTRQELGPATEGSPLNIHRARQLETEHFKSRLRSSGMLARQQFSTPLPIARAAQIVAGVRPGEKVLEPTAGTGNLVNFLRNAGVHLDVNEIEPRRVAVLRQLGLRPSTEDALRLPLNGKRYNAVITNPPYGSATTGKYAGFGATEFPASDIAQRFVAAALEQLVDGGRLVAVMPPNTFLIGAKKFRNWLEKYHTPVAYIESPEGAYHGRGTDTGTVLLVVDKGRRPMRQPPLIVKKPGWMEWERHLNEFLPGGARARTTAHEPAVDEKAIAAEAKAKAPKKEAQLITHEPARTIEEETPPHEPRGEPHVRAGPSVAPRPGEQSGEPGGAAPVERVRPVEPAPEPRGGGGARADGHPAVVAEAGAGQLGEDAGVRAAAVVPEVPRRAVEPREGDSPERRREIEAANASPVFTPYSLGALERRTPHPRLVVETRAMAGLPAPPTTAKTTSKLLDAAWGRDGAKGGLSDEQMDGVLRALTAWDKGHGFLAADDVGVGKTREAAGLVLEAIARGAKRILYTTKNENNVADAMREFRLVASGKEEGTFPAEMVFVGDYKKVKTGEESLPVPDSPVVYFAHSYNFKAFAAALGEVKPTVWIADEAHEFKNQYSDRGMAWRSLHDQVLAANGHLAYFTATPAVTLDELGYLYGLREWPIGGFSDWVDRKLGRKGAEETSAGGEAAAEASSADVREMGDRSEDVAHLSDEDKFLKTGKKKFMRGKPDVFQSKVTPAETEQVMRELKGAGKYIARDLWRGGVQFDVHEVDLLGDAAAVAKARARYDQAATLTRAISRAARQFGRMNAKVKTAGLDRALIQSYLKQLLFDLRLPTVLREGHAALDAGEQVVISVHSVTGDAELEEGLSADDAEMPMNERLRSAINRINTEHVEKVGKGETAEFVELGEIPEALLVRASLLDQLAALEPLVDPVRAIEQSFGKKNVAVITGKRTAKQRKAAMGEFQSGARSVALISKAGKVGISLHDVNGARRRMLVADYEWSADTFKQELGRVDRTGQKSSPHVSLVASNLAGEKKFAATIAARMASLGATSKGSAESTGTDALDQFDVSDGISLNAMRAAVTEMSDDQREHFTGSQFVEVRKVGAEQWEFFPKRTPDSAGMRDFLLELMMFPVRTSNDVWGAWVAKRDALRTGEEAELQATRRTGRGKGTVLRRITLTAPKDPPLTMVELRNEAGEKRAVLQGFVTPYINEIQDARGASDSGQPKSRRYVHVTTPDGELVTGLELTAGEARRVRGMFGKGERKTITPDEAWQDLEAGDDVAVTGAGGDRWVLHQRRDGRIQIRGATIAKHKSALQGLAKYETVGNYLYVPGNADAATAFLERFPPRVDAPTPGDKPPAVGGMTDLHSFTDPFTAALAMLRAARKLHAQRMAQQATAVAKAPKPKKLTKKQRQAALHAPPDVGRHRDALRRTFAPASRTEGAARMGRLKGHELALEAQRNERAIEALDAFRKTLDRLPAHSAPDAKDFSGARWQWAFDMEAGRPPADPALAAVSQTVRDLLDQGRRDVQALGTGKLESFIEHYMPHAWVDPTKAVSWIKRVLGKRPLEGPKSFLKRRTIASLEEGIDAGLEPVSDHPLDLVLLKLREMNRYVTWHRIFQRARADGMLKLVRPSKRLPDGWAFIDDSMATVFGKRGDEGELRIRGRYAAPEPIARIINNYLKPGLRGNAIYDSYMRVGNILNLVQLGWSAFHAGFVAFDATVSTGAVGLEELLTKGRRLSGLKHVGLAAASAATGPVTIVPLLAPVLSYLKGRDVFRSYMVTPPTPELEAIVDGLLAGGGRVRMDSFYKAGFLPAFRKALKDRRWAVAGLELPFAATELVMKPLLEHIVPRMKLGAFMTLWEAEMARLPSGATIDDVRKAAKSAWDSIDNRLGQLVYDNLDWGRVTKDVLMASIRSVGWNVGTTREIGGGAGDLLRLPGRVRRGDRVMTHRMAYVAMLAALVALYGAVSTYLHTGDLPGEQDGESKGLRFLLTDLYFPRTGNLNPDGQPERVTPPTYVKDIVGFARHRLTTVAHKVQPLLTALYDIVWANEDFYGDAIRNPDDPFWGQALQVLEAVAKQGTPFTVRNLFEEKKRTAGALSQAEGFLGVTAAPREIVRTPAQNKMQEYLRQRMPQGRTPEERDRAMTRAELRQAIRQGTLPRRDAIQEGRERGVITTPQQAHALARMGKENPQVSKFKQLTAEEAQRVFDLGSPDEQALWKPYLRLKLARAGLLRRAAP